MRPFSPVIVAPNETNVLFIETKNEHLLIEISVPSNSIVRNIDFQESLFPYGLSSRDSYNVIIRKNSFLRSGDYHVKR